MDKEDLKNLLKEIKKKRIEILLRLIAQSDHKAYERFKKIQRFFRRN
jgi:hypothetical protein